MNDFDPNSFEAELRTLQPAQPDQESLRRIRARLPGAVCVARKQRPVTLRLSSARFLRWLLPGSLAAAVCAALLAGHWAGFQRAPQPAPFAATAPALKADHVEIDRQWVTDFDAIGTLPSGQPVRFRCEQWMEKVRIRDSSAGLVLERTTPRLEIVPVKLEVY